MLNDDELLRYSRHILLDEIGITGQETWKQSHALIVGAGGLGAPAAMYLAASGMGKITICDGDTVDLTNLQRQIIHSTEGIGLKKVDSAKQTLEKINPTIEIICSGNRLTGSALDEAVSSADVVLDCSDNFETRHAVNKACVKFKIPLVSGASIKFDGQLAVFDPRNPESPCYQCLFPEDKDHEEVRCSAMGVFAPLVGIIGATQANEALKVLLQNMPNSTGKLLLLDALTMRWREIKLTKDQNCTVCGLQNT